MKNLFLGMFYALSILVGQAHATPKIVDLRILDKYTFTDLYADLLGIHGNVPAQATVDFDKNLKAMWDKKLARKHGVTKPVEESADDIVRYYTKNQTKMSLQEYINWINHDIENLKKSIDWAGLCGARLKGKRCDLLRSVMEKTYGIDIVAYGMTELFPSDNGTLNVRLMDVLLSNAGRQYLESVPALHDKYLSFGLWQFTQFAVYDANKQVRGASSINVHIAKKYKIPGSVLKLRNEDHHRAAFMFAIYNMRDLVRRMNDREIANLLKGYDKHQDELVQFIAAAHHLPSPAITGARKWAANNMKLQLRMSLKPRLAKYATKTQGNLVALYAMKQKRDRM